jgi:hypothetical protein
MRYPYVEQIDCIDHSAAKIVLTRNGFYGN